MVNKIFKTIHTEYKKIFSFIFYIRYLFVLFFISIIVFLIIPNFFDHNKNITVFKDHLMQKYNLDLEQYDEIKFRPLPIPSLEFQNVQVNVGNISNLLNVKSLKIFPKFINIYNYNNFQSNKIILNDGQIILETFDLKPFIKKIFYQKNKIFLDNLNIQIRNKKKLIFKIEEINYANFGYGKDLIKGRIFEKNFKVELKDNLNNIKFNLKKSGISGNIDFDNDPKKNTISGIFKSKILNTNLKFNFKNESKKIYISKLYLRNKNISFKNNSYIIFDPFFEISSKFQVDNINTQFLKSIDLNKLLISKSFLKKMNIKNEIQFTPKKFNRDLVDNLKLKIDLAYGRMIFSKKFSIDNNFFECGGNLNLLEEYPILFFDCKLNSNNKKNLFKKIFS